MDADVLLETLTVRNLFPEQEVVVRHAWLQGGVVVEGCLGSVWLQDLRDQPFLVPTLYRIQNAAFVTLKDVVSEEDGILFSVAAPAAEVHNSSVFAFASRLLGRSQALSSVAPGAPGIQHYDGEVLLYGCTVGGGDGEDGKINDPECAGADGGSAVALGATAELIHIGSDLLEGSGGTGGSFGGMPCDDGADGVSIALEPGAVNEPLAGAAQKFDLSSPVREGAASHIEVQGASDMSVLLLASPRPAHQLLEDLGGALLIDSSDFYAFSLGSTDASGSLEFDLAISQLPPGQAFARFYTQPLYFHAPVGFFLGSGSTLEILDAAY